jgi:hypothetical protein
MPFAAKKLDVHIKIAKGWLTMNHPFTLFSCFFAFPLVPRCLKAYVYEELYYIIGRIGEKHGDPMLFIHMVRGINSVRRAERTEHLGRKLEIDYVDHLVTSKSEFFARNSHNDRVPLAVIRVPEYRSFKILVKGIVRRSAESIKAILKIGLFCHFNAPSFCYYSKYSTFAEQCQLQKAKSPFAIERSGY